MTPLTGPALRVLIGVGFAIALIAFGFWIKGSVEARQDLKQARAETTDVKDQADRYDTVVADKIKTDAAVDAAVNRILLERAENKAHDPAYREYLDSPIPEPSRRLYELAGQIDYSAAGADGTDPGANDGD